MKNSTFFLPLQNPEVSYAQHVHFKILKSHMLNMFISLHALLNFAHGELCNHCILNHCVCLFIYILYARDIAL